MAKPGAWEDYPWGETVWKVGKKVFTFGSADRITVKSTLDRQAALVQHPNIEVAAYVGRHGWVTIFLRDEDTLALALDLVDDSYEAVAPKRRRVAT